jgi:hypothetical protein
MTASIDIATDAFGFVEEYFYHTTVIEGFASTLSQDTAMGSFIVEFNLWKDLLDEPLMMSEGGLSPHTKRQ